MLATAAFAATKGEYQRHVRDGSYDGQEGKTDCSINAEIDGRTYASATDAKTEFMKDPGAIRRPTAKAYAAGGVSTDRR